MTDAKKTQNLVCYRKFEGKTQKLIPTVTLPHAKTLCETLNFYFLKLEKFSKAFQKLRAFLISLRVPEISGNLRGQSSFPRKSISEEKIFMKISQEFHQFNGTSAKNMLDRKYGVVLIGCKGRKGEGKARQVQHFIK